MTTYPKPFAWGSSDRLISDSCFMNNSIPQGVKLDPRSGPKNSTWILVGPAFLWTVASTANQKPRHPAHQCKRKQPAAARRGFEHELIIHPALNQCDDDDNMRRTGIIGCHAMFQVARDCLERDYRAPSGTAGYWLPPTHQELW